MQIPLFKPRRFGAKASALKLRERTYREDTVKSPNPQYVSAGIDPYDKTIELKEHSGKPTFTKECMGWGFVYKK